MSIDGWRQLLQRGLRQRCRRHSGLSRRLPDDPDKTEPGACGCAGSRRSDTDGDGIPDCIDPCPTWPGDCSEDGQTLFVGSDDGAEAIQLALTVSPGRRNDLGRTRHLRGTD